VTLVSEAVRFDDRLATIMRQTAANPAACAAQWGQVADILAQDRGAIDPAQRRSAIDLLDNVRSAVPVARRASIANAVAHSRIVPDLLAIFANDVPAVSAPVLRVAAIDNDAWGSIIPDLPSTSRALLRERRDLSPAVTHMLVSFGSGDFGLTTNVAQAIPKPVVEVRPTQISDLVARIEAFKRDRDARPRPSVSITALPTFRFETDDQGMIDWVEGVPRGAVIGMSISALAPTGCGGVDGQAVGAFRKRSLFRNARMLVLGKSEAAGTWLIAATPMFDAASGAFTGYRGTATRASESQTGAIPQSFTDQTGLPADSVRQLVHELRTPLNAIRGFGEMIAGQIMGPVSHPYRKRAGAVADDAASLMDILSDLEAAARFDGDDVPVAVAGVVADIMTSVAISIEPVTTARNVHLRISTPTDMTVAAVDETAFVTLLGRLVAVITASANIGETIDITAKTHAGRPCVQVSRPSSLAGLDEATLLDPSLDYEHAPPLGLGFSLRLIANRARAVGGQLRIDDQNFTLILPAVQDSAEATKESS
jgi:signal transduction histidine kinase